MPEDKDVPVASDSRQKHPVDQIADQLLAKNNHVNNNNNHKKYSNNNMEKSNATSSPYTSSSSSSHLHELILAEKLDLEAKMLRLGRRKRWLTSHAPFLRTLLSYCSLHGADGGGLSSVRMELILLLQELQQEKPANKLLNSPLPFPTTLPLLSASVAGSKTVPSSGKERRWPLLIIWKETACCDQYSRKQHVKENLTCSISIRFCTFSFI